jgi:uncharacterized flavoprotein (TIGR03862 family)
MTAETRIAAIVGGGPAGLMAAEVLSAAGGRVHLYDRMANVGRKFLLAGRGGLNLTHSEAFETFVARYGAAAAHLRPVLEAFPPAALMAWAEGLGQEIFTGSSGRVFPKAMKASPLLRAWLARLRGYGVQFHTRHEWRGWDANGALLFQTPDGPVHVTADATILALGGASWPRLGSDGAWMRILSHMGIETRALQPANCGFTVPWSEMFKTRFAGQPLKNIAVTFAGRTVRGECVVTDYGLEGGVIYALSAPIRDSIAAQGSAQIAIDVRPDATIAQLAKRLERPKRHQSMANVLRKAAHMSPLEINLLREAHGADIGTECIPIAQSIKSSVLTLTGTQGLARAISTAGGVAFDAVDEHLMLRAKPGVFVAGEMLDWEAPTGGYLLQACMATGVAAAKGALRHLQNR